MFRIAALILVVSLSSFAAGGSQLSIKKYRFNHHSSIGLDRLVIEFGMKGHGSPKVRMSPQGTETTIVLENASLVGAIPEANINDSYQKKSQFLGPIAINTDMADGFAIRVFAKNPLSKTEVFWMENPARLVIDGFAPSSVRAQGPHVVKPQRSIASFGGGSKKKEKDTVYCFNATSTVKAYLGYEKGDTFKGIPMQVENPPPAGTLAPEQIICYPKSAQVMPKVTFSNGEPQYRIERSESSLPVPVPVEEYKLGPPPGITPGIITPSAAPAAKPLLPPPTTWTPPTSPKLPPASGWTPPAGTTPKVSEKEAALNREADQLLGDDDDKPARSAASEGEWKDNFNKNNPPPTLGKSLLPPSTGATGKTKPQLANPGSPASLLPPLR